MGFCSQEYWNGLPCPPPGDLLNLGVKLMSLMSPALAMGSLPPVAPGKPMHPIHILEKQKELLKTHKLLLIIILS